MSLMKSEPLFWLIYDDDEKSKLNPVSNLLRFRFPWKLFRELACGCCGWLKEGCCCGCLKVDGCCWGWLKAGCKGCCLAWVLCWNEKDGFGACCCCCCCWGTNVDAGLLKAGAIGCCCCCCWNSWLWEESAGLIKGLKPSQLAQAGTLLASGTENCWGCCLGAENCCWGWGWGCCRWTVGWGLNWAALVLCWKFLCVGSAGSMNGLKSPLGCCCYCCWGLNCCCGCGLNCCCLTGAACCWGICCCWGCCSTDCCGSSVSAKFGSKGALWRPLAPSGMCAPSKIRNPSFPAEYLYEKMFEVMKREVGKTE